MDIPSSPILFNNSYLTTHLVLSTGWPRNRSMKITSNSNRSRSLDNRKWTSVNYYHLPDHSKSVLALQYTCTQKYVNKLATGCTITTATNIRVHSTSKTISGLIDWVKVLHPIRHKTGHFGDALSSQSIDQYWENKIKTRRNNHMTQW